MEGEDERGKGFEGIHHMGFWVDDLPETEELIPILRGIAKSCGLIKRLNTKIVDEENIVEAARGLTSMEAEGVFAMSYVEQQKFVPEVIAREKAEILRGRFLEIIEDDATMADVGGLHNLKLWITPYLLPQIGDRQVFDVTIDFKVYLICPGRKTHMSDGLSGDVPRRLLNRSHCQ